MHDFVVIYGLPASGKTTLCEYMVKHHGFFYASVVYSKDRKFSMWETAANAYTNSGYDKPLITEGVLRNTTGRERFCMKIWQAHVERLHKPKIFYLTEAQKELVSRRPGWERRFSEMEHDPGSEKFEHFILDGIALPTLSERAEFIMEKLRQS